MCSCSLLPCCRKLPTTLLLCSPGTALTNPLTTLADGFLQRRGWVCPPAFLQQHQFHSGYYYYYYIRTPNGSGCAGLRPSLDPSLPPGSVTERAAPCPSPGPCLQAAEQRGLVLEAACITANAIVLIGLYEFPPEFLRNTSTLEGFIRANFRLQSQTVYQMNLHRRAYSYAAPLPRGCSLAH